METKTIEELKKMKTKEAVRILISQDIEPSGIAIAKALGMHPVHIRKLIREIKAEKLENDKK